MNKNSTITIFIIISIAVSVIYVSYKSNFPDKDEIVNNNFINITKIEVRMSRAKVDSIMGHPDIIMPKNSFNSYIVYKYKIPEELSGVCQVYFDSSMKVVDLLYFVDESDSTELYE